MASTGARWKRPGPGPRNQRVVDSEATKVLTPVPGLGPFVKEAKGSRGPVFSKATDISRLPRLSGGPKPRGAILGPGAKWGPATLLKDLRHGPTRMGHARARNRRI